MISQCIQQMAMKILKENPNIANNPNAQSMINVIQSGDEKKGQEIAETTMVATPGAANASNNVATSTLIKNCCGDYDRITVTNTGTADVTVAANSAFIVRRLA